MTEKLREQISALVDDELPAGEHELLARRFAAEKHLCIRWERYHLIGEAMRKALPHVDTGGFADRIMMAYAQKEEVEQHGSLSGFFGKTAAGVVVAACVAVVAIVGLRHDSARMQVLPAPSEIVPPPTLAQTGALVYGSVSNANWNGNVPDVQAELNNYIINHNEIIATLGQQSVLPYFYITTYVAQKQARKQPQAKRQSDHRDKP